MTDAFDVLRLPDAPLAPPSHFAEQLRSRLERALGIAADLNHERKVPP